MARFLFATGIENSSPTIRLPDGTRKRIDEMEKSDHYRRFREDFQLVKELGLEFLRYGPPLYRTLLGPGCYDWAFADESLNRLKELAITPIADLCHFGLPDFLGDFQNPDFPRLFAEYTAAFARRYPWIRHYTPVNEISVAARFSAKYGWWNECLASDAAYVRALKHLCKANVLGMHAILAAQPAALFIQSEASQYYHPEEPACMEQANFLNERRFLALDLTYGHPPSVLLYEYLLEHGFSKEEFHWFHDHHVKNRCIMGTDYYGRNEHLVHRDGTTSASGEIFGYYVITHQYFKRYKLPVMHTETNLMDANQAPSWLKKEWANAHLLKQDGVPILGFTWYSLLDQVDWDTALREDAGRVNPLGLYDLNRQVRPVGEAYRQLVARWREVLALESFDPNLL